MADAPMTRSSLEALVSELREEASRLYCRYADEATRNELLLGQRVKLERGEFTEAHLAAHCQHYGQLERHRALMYAAAKLSALLSAPAGQEPALCGARQGRFVCNLSVGHKGCHEDRAENGGCVAWAPEPAAAAGCQTRVCELAKPTGVMCADNECDIASGVRPAAAAGVGLEERLRRAAHAWQHFEGDVDV